MGDLSGELIERIDKFLEEQKWIFILLEKYSWEQLVGIGGIIDGKVEGAYSDAVLNNFAGVYLYYFKKEVELGIGYLQEAAKSENPEALYNLFRIFSERADADASMFRERCFKTKYFVGVLYRGEECYGNKDIGGALMYYGESIEEFKRLGLRKIYPHQVGEIVAAFRGMGNCHFDQGKYDTAVEYYRRGLEINPVDADLLYAIALGYDLGEKYREAFEYYLKVFKVAPGHENILYHLGSCYYRHGKKEKALEYYLEAYKNKNKYLVDLLSKMGLIYVEKRNHVEAVRYFREVVDVDIDPEVFSNALARERQKVDTILSVARKFVESNLALACEYYLLILEKSDVARIELLNCFDGDVNKLNRLYVVLRVLGNRNPAVSLMMKRIEGDNGVRLMMNRMNMIKFPVGAVCCRCRGKKNMIIMDCFHVVCCVCLVNFEGCGVCPASGRKVKYGGSVMDNARKFKINADCPVCLVDTILIPRKCAHYYCKDHYVEPKRCPICEN
ncbi:MAG: hypothetical protein Hyperionvirus24_35 [Hyperionvirus sp.]|uniref:Uncharacterized protein n=1 Tax=Hyperionvirus sp. TaxID=2487770 RepID=A0A3G5AEV1_9VIRU|nr:MAG: hypothetical protein Hyperionvirus24_35 [Hyperionvirus sp.]